MMTRLFDQNCSHQSGPPLDVHSVKTFLTELKQPWSLDTEQKHIEYDFMFNNFHETMSFVNALAWISNQQDHHPDLEVGYKHCLVRFSTHSVTGLSINDFICASRTEKLLS